MDIPTNSCLVYISNLNSINQIKKACLIYDKVVPLFRTRKYQAKRQRFPLLDTDFNKFPICYGNLVNTPEYIQTISELEFLSQKNVLDCPVSDYVDTDVLEDFNTIAPVWIYGTHNSRRSWQNDHETFMIDDIQHIDIPIFLSNNYYISNNVAPNNINNKNHILEILLTNFPTPKEDTPWELILDWRNDKTAQSKLIRLKNWVNTIAEKPNLNINHLKDEINCLLNEYENYMHIKKIKYSHSVVRQLVTTTGEIIEDILKLKIKDILDIPFKLTEKNILLQESELSAPGRELAYIISTKDYLNSL